MVGCNNEVIQLTSSPQGRFYISEGNGACKTVEEEFNIDSVSMFEVHYNKPKKVEVNTNINGNINGQDTTSPDERTNTLANHETKGQRVRWVDETFNIPLASETIEGSRERSNSLAKCEEVKPILKHKATCITIISDS
ncbi:hypothetical protein ACJMK2_040945 [Sinanodonta woodiana]|uniref:Uncharacterized protein n=1 Tax=Sinanodonta woodiana TaxID=1069815 RepID=A0ABD3W2M4_SINWO